MLVFFFRCCHWLTVPSAAAATMVIEDDLSYHFEMYYPPLPPDAGVPNSGAQHTVSPPLPEARNCSTSCAAPVTLPASPFATSQTCDSQDGAATAAVDSIGMFSFDYAVPASPFAACSTGPATACAVSQDSWQGSCGMGSLLTSLQTALPGSSALTPGHSERLHLRSQHSSAMVSVSSQ